MPKQQLLKVGHDSGKNLNIYEQGLHTRDRPRFFDQVGHQTTNASIGNKHFFTK